MRRHIGFGLLFAFTVTAAYAGDGCHVIKKLALPKQQLTVVVSSGLCCADLFDPRCPTRG